MMSLARGVLLLCTVAALGHVHAQPGVPQLSRISTHEPDQRATAVQTHRSAALPKAQAYLWEEVSRTSLRLEAALQLPGDASGAWAAAQQLHVLWTALSNFNAESNSSKYSKSINNSKRGNQQNLLGIKQFEIAEFNNGVETCAEIWGQIHHTASAFQAAVELPSDNAAVWASTKHLHILWTALEQNDCAGLLSGDSKATTSGSGFKNPGAKCAWPRESVQLTSDPSRDAEGSRSEFAESYHDPKNLAASRHNSANSISNASGRQQALRQTSSSGDSGDTTPLRNPGSQPGSVVRGSREIFRTDEGWKLITPSASEKSSHLSSLIFPALQLPDNGVVQRIRHFFEEPEAIGTDAFVKAVVERLEVEHGLPPGSWLGDSRNSQPIPRNVQKSSASNKSALPANTQPLHVPQPHIQLEASNQSSEAVDTQSPEVAQRQSSPQPQSHVSDQKGPVATATFLEASQLDDHVDPSGHVDQRKAERRLEPSGNLQSDASASDGSLGSSLAQSSHGRTNSKEPAGKSTWGAASGSEAAQQPHPEEVPAGYAGSTLQKMRQHVTNTDHGSGQGLWIAASEGLGTVTKAAAKASKTAWTAMPLAAAVATRSVASNIGTALLAVLVAAFVLSLPSLLSVAIGECFHVPPVSKVTHDSTRPAALEATLADEPSAVRQNVMPSALADTGPTDTGGKVYAAHVRSSADVHASTVAPLPDASPLMAVWIPLGTPAAQQDLLLQSARAGMAAADQELKRLQQRGAELTTTSTNVPHRSRLHQPSHPSSGNQQREFEAKGSSASAARVQTSGHPVGKLQELVPISPGDNLQSAATPMAAPLHRGSAARARPGVAATAQLPPDPRRTRLRASDDSPSPDSRADASPVAPATARLPSNPRHTRLRSSDDSPSPDSGADASLTSSGLRDDGAHASWHAEGSIASANFYSSGSGNGDSGNENGSRSGVSSIFGPESPSTAFDILHWRAMNQVQDRQTLPESDNVGAV